MLQLLVFGSVCETKVAYGATWLKVFMHDSSSGQYFLSYSEALNSNGLYKFSIMGEIDGKYKNNGKFEFLLEYPQFNKYNRWKQTYNPKDNPEVEGMSAVGYEDVNITYRGRTWGGLVKSSDFRTAFDGSAGDGNWFYAVGSYAQWGNAREFPGPAVNDNTYYGVKKVLLWVRIDNTLYMSTIVAKSYTKRSLMNILAISILFIY